MSFTITVEDKCTLDQKKIAVDARNCFSRAYDGKKSSKYDVSLSGKNIRALSIDLGLKQFGACTVGEVTYGDDLIALPDISFERMFLLKLPGDHVDAEVNQSRLDAMRELRQLRTEIRYLSLLKQVFNQDEIGRKKILERGVEYYQHPDKKETLQYCLNVNNTQLQNECLADAYSKLIQSMNKKMEEFRSGENTRKQERLYRPGKSYWSILYLEELRKVIISWNSLGYRIEDENKPMSRGYGVTATRLLEHIQNIKDDRIKTGADYIIQSALGYYYDEERHYWVQKYKPCHVIIFEDLSRYRFSLDRPARENSKLMQWSHREIVNETIRQAAVYGIEVYDSTDASYTSKFSYKSDTPGIRCDRLSKMDFDSSGLLKTSVYDQLPNEMKAKAGDMKPGTIIPSEIGSLFVTLDPDGKLFMINADINAACNLQKRFFGMHTQLLRINTMNDDGYLRLKNDIESDVDGLAGLGKREKGKYLYHYGTAKLILVATETPGHFKMIPRRKNADYPYIGKDRTYNLFHDPSGVFIDSEEWTGYKEFWSRVENSIIKRLTELI